MQREDRRNRRAHLLLQKDLGSSHMAWPPGVFIVIHPASPGTSVYTALVPPAPDTKRGTLPRQSCPLSGHACAWEVGGVIFASFSLRSP